MNTLTLGAYIPTNACVAMPTAIVGPGGTGGTKHLICLPMSSMSISLCPLARMIHPMLPFDPPVFALGWNPSTTVHRTLSTNRASHMTLGGQEETVGSTTALRQGISVQNRAMRMLSVPSESQIILTLKNTNLIYSPRYLERVVVKKTQSQVETSAIQVHDSDSSDSNYVQSESEDGSSSVEADCLTDDDLTICADRTDGVRRIRLLSKIASKATPDRQTLFQHDRYPAIKLQWEEFLENDPKVPSEYSPEIFRVLIDELEVSKATLRRSNSFSPINSVCSPLVSQIRHSLTKQSTGTREPVSCTGLLMFTAAAIFLQKYSFALST
jgi:hypothetical protein